ncbi:dephospho-CoA kinase [Limnohabitans sp. T6-20]|jgi:dephospho-CoA kinase|uniref:dephospho-CoA kinase n=1 Tax=Limnohabitans sp. T6-20 TaxID=1100725 RepID=UPI000D38A922|nr:dephospho-CoA kinase [Limnohabitans sp. T6-20]PUE12064.1 dephospho-CoA kinase [Limnohabitans sp. T6-20]
MNHQRIWRIGLTGGIGSGKSTVAGLLAARGAAVIDADAISRSVTAPGGRAMASIAQVFGPQMVDADGAMNRQAMRERVFQNPETKKQLEAIIHPLVSLITAEQAQAALQKGQRCLVFDVPLLVESGERWRRQVDRVVVVDCDADTQRQRVMARSGLAAEEIDRIIALQASRAQRLACADVVIFNQGLSLAELEGQVAQVAADFGL